MKRRDGKECNRQAFNKLLQSLYAGDSFEESFTTAYGKTIGDVWQLFLAQMQSSRL